MNKYGQYCPMARAAEILGDRWTLLIVRDLLYGVQHFNDLERGLPGISRALLSNRLRRLQQSGIIERQLAGTGRAIGYRLTPAGQELMPVVDSLVLWGAKWAFGEPDPDELDPVLLLWWVRDGIYIDRLPSRRIVIEFHFRGVPKGPDTYWMVVDEGDISVCLTHPGLESDVVITADLSVFYQVWAGSTDFTAALRSGRISIDGVPALTRALPRWFTLSPIAGQVRKVIKRQHR